jgi:hypothetical protein
MKRFSRIVLLALAGWSLPCAAAAQGTASPTQTPPRVVSVEERNKMEVEQAAGRGGARYIVGVETRVTAGKPYSAEAVTESLQVLGDGNRITKKSVTRVYRDNDGRTRREQLADNGQPRSITISDPVGGLSYSLDPESKVAYQTGSVRAPNLIPPSGTGRAGGGGGRGGAMAATGVPLAPARAVAAPNETQAQREERLREVERARAAGVEQAETSQAASRQSRQVLELAASGRGETTREDLGEQMIEGVRATGTRNTTVIPAGSPIGNVNEIKIVSEQWISSDLDVLVLTRHSDPRVGETVYKLTNIVRAQPDPNLFTVPADYKLQNRSIRSPQ